MLFIVMRSERRGESVKRHLPADIFYRGQDAAVNFTEENETHTRVNREEFNGCKICDCSSSGEKWTEVNRNRMKYTAVITSVFSYPLRDW